MASTIDRMLKKFLILFFVFFLATSADPAVSKAANTERKTKPAITDEAQRIFQAHGNAVYQIQVIDNTSGKKTSTGSGFQFTADGRMATNYHVVAEAVQRPDSNRLVYLQGQNIQGPLVIETVDVVHDLAIVRMDNPGKTFLNLGADTLPKGARLFALGNPHDIGFSIIEGTYNGISEESFIDKIHFSGSLNPGMSGGPVVSHGGEVIGVNVSTAGNQISFLVPVHYLRSLARQEIKLKKGETFTDVAATQIEQQLLDHQDQIIARLSKKPWESMAFGPFMLPGRIDHAFKCWGMQAHEKKDPFKYYQSFCASQDRVFLDDHFDSGGYGYRYDYIVGNDDLNNVRFYALYQQQYAGMAEGEGDSREDDVTNYDCTTRFVLAGKSRWKSSFCVRQYKKYPQLFDLTVSMALTGKKKKGVMLSFMAEGVSKDNSLKLAQTFIDSIAENPEAAAAPVLPADLPPPDTDAPPIDTTTEKTP